MSLFNLFKKKDQAENTGNPPQIDPEIEILTIKDGSHGDNFGALIGFDSLNSDQGRQFLNDIIGLSLKNPAVAGKNSINLHETRFNKRLGLRTLAEKRGVVSAFPYLETSYQLPFKTRRIREWAHVGSVEAEIEGGGRDTFGFGFFATDYAVNQDKYKANKDLNVKVSAIALVLQRNEETEIGGHQLSEGFAAYMPSQQITRPTYFDFIGVLTDIQPADLTAERPGYLVRVKLINDESDPEFFTVDMFVNRENLRGDHFEKGMRVSGLLWFQGEIA